MTGDIEVAFTEKPKLKPVPPRGILTAPDFRINKVRGWASSNGFDQPSILGGMATRLVTWPEAFLAGPVLGAAMAVMALEELIHRGAREIIFLGSAGCLSADLPIGTVFSPASGVSTEGTSPHYPAPLAADADLRARVISAGTESGLMNPAEQDQIIWSTDGIYRETAALVEARKKDGATTVDMETTALFAAAAFRGVKLAAVLVVSDQIVDTSHHTGFHKREFKSAVQSASELAWKVVTAG